MIPPLSLRFNDGQLQRCLDILSLQRQTECVKNQNVKHGVRSKSLLFKDIDPLVEELQLR